MALAAMELAAIELMAVASAARRSLGRALADRPANAAMHRAAVRLTSAMLLALTGRDEAPSDIASIMLRRDGFVNHSARPTLRPQPQCATARSHRMPIAWRAGAPTARGD